MRKDIPSTLTIQLTGVHRRSLLHHSEPDYLPGNIKIIFQV